MMSETFGQRITNYAIEMVQCPTCQVEPGNKCRSRNGHTEYPRHGQHMSRWRRAKQELLAAQPELKVAHG